MHGAQFGFEPRATRLHLRRARLLVNTPLAARLPLEMLHRVGDIHVVARDAGVSERFVKQRTGRPDERLALPILLIARLLAHEHHAGTLRPGAEHDLRRRLVEIASATFMCRCTKNLQTCRRRNEGRCRSLTTRIRIVWTSGRSFCHALNTPASLLVSAGTATIPTHAWRRPDPDAGRRPWRGAHPWLPDTAAGPLAHRRLPARRRPRRPAYPWIHRQQRNRRTARRSRRDPDHVWRWAAVPS